MPSTGGASATGGTQRSGIEGCSLPSFIDTQSSPIGWASQGSGTTGGGEVAPILVTTLADLSNVVKGVNAAVVYVKGNLAQGTLTIGSNKTIIGCSEGGTINGHVQLSGSKNVIVRNLHITGYNCAPPDVDVSNGGVCQYGEDTITAQATSTNLWFDHDAISDGSDGNLDISHASDYITVSYTKFFYSTQRNDPNDTGAAGHRYSSLKGHSDSNASEDTGHLNITFHHDWWSTYAMQRMPRVRFGKVHLFNNLWTAAGNAFCIGVGVGANVLNEYNAFIGVKTVIDTTGYSDASSVAKSLNNLYSNLSGNPVADLSPSSVFVPPYAYTPEAASAVQADISENAGPH
jgi:pectate lyase